MLSSQTPTLVLKDGQVQMVTGSPGGRTIPNTTLWVVLNRSRIRPGPPQPPSMHRAPITSGFPMSSSSKAGRGRNQCGTALLGMGHRIKVVNRQGIANTIVVDRPANEDLRNRRPAAARPPGPPAIERRRRRVQR